MRAINVILTWLISLALFLCVFEGGLRLMGMGPAPILLEFDRHLGWANRPDATSQRKSSEFDVTFEINSLGLRDDPMESAAKAPNSFRVLALGDSFTLGFSVNREDLFVDQLERWWQAEGRKTEIINTGTEGYSTDQAAVWLAQNGAAFAPDLVLLFAYENDLYWNGQTSYSGKQKPRFDARGKLDSKGPFPEPPAASWTRKLALATLWERMTGTQATPARYLAEGASREMLAEFAVLLPAPPGFVTDAVARTGGALAALKRTSADLGCEFVLIPIPSHSAVDEEFAPDFGHAVLGLEAHRWSPDLPVETFLSLAANLEIPTIDPRAALRGAHSSGEPQYYTRDWHLNPAGNRTLTATLHKELDALGVFGAWAVPKPLGSLPPGVPRPQPRPVWPLVLGALFVALTALHFATYRDLARWRAPLEVGGMLSAVALIIGAGSAGLDLLSPLQAKIASVLFVGGLLIFIAYKLGRRLTTISELLWAFSRRGHWYLMPLVVVLLSIGSLLVVAASSPLVAPFIYTLF
ncbi:MAG: DUF5989 family protein [bacterium]|nr:hypothetical protein [Planctomycetota bacterium]HIL51736.1 hypothetical protein [Planctomycetota bacterium]